MRTWSFGFTPSKTILHTLQPLCLRLFPCPCTSSIQKCGSYHCIKHLNFCLNKTQNCSEICRLSNAIQACYIRIIEISSSYWSFWPTKIMYMLELWDMSWKPFVVIDWVSLMCLLHLIMLVSVTVCLLVAMHQRMNC